jgi:DNA modification methylase
MIIHGDCLIEMAKMEANSIDFIVTDPPYGLHFMGKHWDHGVPGREFWEQALRVCKPGAWMAAFGGTRMHHRLMCAIEDAGWEIRDCIMWLYGSGFPKSHNKFGLEGYGTALKPAWEPIILVMKPLEGTFAQNAEKWGVAGINVDESRIPSEPINIGLSKAHLGNKYGSGTGGRGTNETYINTQGRWPANLILDEEAGQILDQQSGKLKSGLIEKHHRINTQRSTIYEDGLKECTGLQSYGDSGGASRFFYCAKASSRERNEGLEGMPLTECQTGCAGAMPIDDNGKERDRFKKTCQNHHPTVKPLSLMKYIIKLLAPPGNPILLDPFAGSGTTILAAKQLGIQAIGIELEKEYCEIAQKRLEGGG